MTPVATRNNTLVLFNYDWDEAEFARLRSAWPHDSAGFDLFSFPSNVNLVGFDIERFVNRYARRAARSGWCAVVSNHEQFGALAAAMLAEKMSWPGTSVNAVLACQHKIYAREILQRVCPEATPRFDVLPAAYGDAIPHHLTYPLFVKPTKAAFSVLARTVANREELQAHTRFGWWELWVIRHLVEPFERVMRERLPAAPTAHSMMIEEPINTAQYSLDGYAFNGEIRSIGCVDSIMYPNTQAFMRFDYPSKLAANIQARALDVATRFLREVGFAHGIFNMEFFYDEATDRFTVIEFNPRMASQFADLYRRVDGVDLHEFALALAHGIDPKTLNTAAPTAGAASSFVYRSFDETAQIAMPSNAAKSTMKAAFPDSLFFEFPKDKKSIARDFKWLGSYRYGIMHLGGADEADLRARCERASGLLGWAAPYSD
jgi:biotin carboxylase